MIDLINKGTAKVYYQTKKAACFDISANESGEIKPGECLAVGTGLYINSTHSEVLEQLEIKSRSGLALKSRVIVFNAPGIIDEDFEDEIKVLLINLHPTDVFAFRTGDRIAQGSISPVFRRGNIPVLDQVRKGGFGSTDV